MKLLTLLCFALLSWAGTGRATAEADEGATEKAPSADGEAKSSADSKSDQASKPDDEAPSGEAGGYRLPGGIHLGGMFDVAYERVDRSADFTSGQNAFRNYHHLLFLTRQGDDFPVGFSAEVLSQYFYELTMRLSGPGSRLRVVAHAGKILVPFGPDPLFHKSYGGLTGSDQRTLPVVWSSFGAGARFSYAIGGLSAADEIYAAQGFDLSAPDENLNMQRDLAAYDGARIALGNRLALSAGPFTLWYSAYWNQMRFGRLLVMQAVDLSLWRPALPALNRFALGAGFVRAHVSATEKYGQPGASFDEAGYYHFADYLWLRAYLTQGFYLQAMSGLATFGNRTGLTYDERQATASDGSHHSVTLVYEYASAQVILAYHWNFEKVDEIPNDFLRLMVIYAF
jgi:hypothetical protein